MRHFCLSLATVHPSHNHTARYVSVYLSSGMNDDFGKPINLTVYHAVTHTGIKYCGGCLEGGKRRFVSVVQQTAVLKAR